MPVINYERHQSRPFNLSTRSVDLVRHWLVSGTMDETTAYLTALLNTPPFYDGLVRDSISAADQGGGVWFVDITYRNLDPQQVLGGSDSQNPVGTGGQGGQTNNPTGPGPTEELTPAFTFEITGKPVHITQSHATTQRRSAAGYTDGDATRVQAGQLGNILDNELAINISGDRVEGTDVYMPELSWTREAVRGSLTLQYVEKLEKLVGKVNDAMFYQRPSGEQLYMGASIKNQNGRWYLTHKFAVSKNRQNVKVGNGITLPDVLGWEYLWVLYRPQAVGDFMLQVPVRAYTETVQEYGDFSQLEIGT